MEEQPNEIDGVIVTDRRKYFGIQLESKSKRNIFIYHRSEMIRKGRQFANYAYSVLAKSCKKMTIGKTFWKRTVLAAWLFGSSI